MTKKEFLKQYKGKAVWCKTEELANEFLELADSFGFKWVDGDKLTKSNNYYAYKENSVYNILAKRNCCYVSKKDYYIDYIIEFKSLKTNSTPQVTFDPPKTILTLNGKEFVSIAKDEPFDKEKGILMCLAKANGFDYDKVSKLVASAKKQTPKLTEAERVILENLPKEWKWIARDNFGNLYNYKNRPFRNGNYWHSAFSEMPFKHLFQFIKCEDKEPYEIAKLLNK